jgi:hypothetical protein
LRLLRTSGARGSRGFALPSRWSASQPPRRAAAPVELSLFIRNLNNKKAEKNTKKHPEKLAYLGNFHYLCSELRTKVLISNHKTMKRDSFLLLRRLNQSGIDSGSWGVIEDAVANMVFPVDSDFHLKGFHLWHWRKADEAQIWPYACYLTLEVVADEKIDFYTLE